MSSYFFCLPYSVYFNIENRVRSIMIENLSGIGDAIVSHFTRDVAGYMVDKLFTFSGFLGHVLF